MRKPVHHVRFVGSQTAISSNNPGSQTITPVTMGPTYPTWLITDNFPIFLSQLPTWDQSEKGKYEPLTDYIGCPVSSELDSGFPLPKASKQGILEAFSFFHYIPPICLSLSVCQNANTQWQMTPLLEQVLNKQPCLLFGWSWFIFTLVMKR